MCARYEIMIAKNICSKTLCSQRPSTTDSKELFYKSSTPPASQHQLCFKNRFPSRARLVLSVSPAPMVQHCVTVLYSLVHRAWCYALNLCYMEYGWQSSCAIAKSFTRCTRMLQDPLVFTEYYSVRCSDHQRVGYPTKS